MVQYVIGYDDNSNCSHYDEYGLATQDILMNVIENGNVDKLYVCYREKPDGIYVDDLFIGNPLDCYNYLFSRNGYYLNVFSLSLDPFGELVFGVSYDENNNEAFFDYAIEKFSGDEKNDLQRIKIIQDGEEYMTLVLNDMTLIDGEIYYVNDFSKIYMIRDYIDSVFNSCS